MSKITSGSAGIEISRRMNSGKTGGEALTSRSLIDAKGIGTRLNSALTKNVDEEEKPGLVL